MKKKFYLSEENNKLFIKQRNICFHKIKNIENLKNRKKIDELLLYTFSNKTIKNLLKYIKLVETIKIIHVIHSGSFNGSKNFKNKFYFNLFDNLTNIKIMIKLFLIGIFEKKIILRKVASIYIYVSSKKSKINLSPINKFKIIRTLPVTNNFKNNRAEYIFKEKKNYKNNIICFVDSHFPLHPDSFKKSKINYVIAKEFTRIYINFLTRRLNPKNKKIRIFLHPRTFNTIKKDPKILKIIQEYKKNYIFLNGVNSLFCLLKINQNLNYKIYVQPGTQLSAIKFNYNFKNRIKVISFDQLFLKKFKELKKKFKSNYLKNYELIEIEQFRYLNVKKFYSMS